MLQLTRKIFFSHLRFRMYLDSSVRFPYSSCLELIKWFANQLMSFKHKKYIETEQSCLNTPGTSNARKNLPRYLEHFKKGFCVLKPIQEMQALFDGETHDHLRKQVYIVE